MADDQRWMTAKSKGLPLTNWCAFHFFPGSNSQRHLWFFFSKAVFFSDFGLVKLIPPENIERIIPDTKKCSWSICLQKLHKCTTLKSMATFSNFAKLKAPFLPWCYLVLFVVTDGKKSNKNKQHFSGQIIATSHDLTPIGSQGREIPLFQGNPGWWNIIIWPDFCCYYCWWFVRNSEILRRIWGWYLLSISYDVFFFNISGGCLGFLNHQQYHMMGSLSGASRGLLKGLNSLCWGWASHL